MKKRIVFLIVTLGLVGGAYILYKYLYKDHRDITNETAIIQIEAKDLRQKFVDNASEEILNKTITVSGKITQIEGNTITLDDAVQSDMLALPKALTHGTEVSVKGRCIGYDDLFEIVKLDQSSIINP
ncbi:MAG: hypothetical protein HKN48_08700 [Flavobacteriaceae bacterium]|nr:hypothetical protein [Flavobacteriaceae bacterium]